MTRLGKTLAVLLGMGHAKPMTLHLMHDKGLAGEGSAMCLDGSDAGFYYAAATSPSTETTWQLFFEGGGWCYDELDCWWRAEYRTGSSRPWGSTARFGGMLSDDCKINPDFCNVHRVYIKYCDGNSFSGDREEPLEVEGPNGEVRRLYFRGKKILDAVLDTLLSKMGLASAEDVLLSGCSAGGLAAYLHADYVHDRLKQAVPGLRKYRVAPVSGFFLRHLTINGKPVYEDQIRYISIMANSSAGLDQKCVAAQLPGEYWRCNFADVTYSYIEARIFSLASALDSWHMKCIYSSDYPLGFPKQKKPGNGNCSAVRKWRSCTHYPEKCATAEAVSVLNQYISDFDSTMQSAVTYSKAGNGAFVNSCYNHCEAAQDWGWSHITLEGVTMQKAFSLWWRTDAVEPASKHSYLPCKYNTDQWPRQCNPTCTEPGGPSSWLSLRFVVVGVLVLLLQVAACNGQVRRTCLQLVRRAVHQISPAMIKRSHSSAPDCNDELVQLAAPTSSNEEVESELTARIGCPHTGAADKKM